MLATDARLLLFRGFPIAASLTDSFWEILSRDAFSTSLSSAWCISLSLELQCNLILLSMFSGPVIILRLSTLIPYGLCQKCCQKIVQLLVSSIRHSTVVLVPKEPCADGHSTSVLAPHVPCWRHTIEVLVLFSTDKSTSLYLQLIFPFSDVWANKVWNAVLRSKSCCPVLLENSLNLAFWTLLAALISLNLPSQVLEQHSPVWSSSWFTSCDSIFCLWFP